MIAGVSAIFATVFNPVAGALSDRSGRRNPWILGGGLAAVPAMFLLGLADTILLVTIAWCLGQAVMNVYQAALTSVVPDRVPVGARGKASAAVGLGLPFGSTLGALVGAAFSEDYRTGYLPFGALVAGAVSGYQLYILQDHTVLPDAMAPEAAVAVMMPLTGVAMVFSTVIGGYLSDRFDRRKLSVGASALLSAVALMIPAVSASWTAMLAFAVVNRLAFGCYMAVDTALVTMVLPKAEDAARDMGVLNVANAGPQIVAPFIASMIVSLSGGYTALFVVAAVLAVAGALAVTPIRSVR
ncbi:MFS transporter [Streptomyces xanthophaeus]|uniref:MFS transporter n=1 Tax=Streptomyces xanthophaeus TaxID=67385 RepID=UPI003437C4E9